MSAWVLVVDVCGRCADEPRRALEVPAVRCDRAEPEKAFGRKGGHDQFATEFELGAERVLCCIGVAGQQRRESSIPADEHLRRGVVGSGGGRLCTADEFQCVVSPPRQIAL